MEKELDLLISVYEKMFNRYDAIVHDENACYSDGYNAGLRMAYLSILEDLNELKEGNK